MIKNFTTLAKSLFALALPVNASGSLSQTLPGRNNHGEVVLAGRAEVVYSGEWLTN